MNKQTPALKHNDMLDAIPEEGVVLDAVLPELLAPIIALHVEANHVLEERPLRGREGREGGGRDGWREGKVKNYTLVLHTPSMLTHTQHRRSTTV